MKKIIEKKILKKIKSEYGEDVNCNVDISLKKKRIIISMNLSFKDLIKILFNKNK